jgi:hypothetical protein
MRFQRLAMGALACGAMVFLQACGAPEPSSAAPAATAAAASAKTGDEAIAALVSADEPAVEEAAPEAAVQEAVEAVEASATDSPAVTVAQAADSSAQPVVAAAGTPRIVVDEPIYDFGRMETGQKREHQWTVRNAGDTDLIIHSVRPSCGCTNTAMADDVIPPGGSTTLTSVLDLPRQVGPVRKNIAISSNDPQQSTMMVAFVGEATQAIMIEPQVLSFQNIEPDAVETLTADIRSTEEGVTFNILDIGFREDGAFDVEYETVEEGLHYRLKVTTRPPLTGSHASEQIIVGTDNERATNVYLTAVATILTDIITAPDVIRLSALHTDPLKRMILLRGGRVTEFAITDVTLPHPDMTYTVTERLPGMLYVEVANIVAHPDLDGTEIIVHTDAPSVPEIRVPISVVGATASLESQIDGVPGLRVVHGGGTATP